MKVPIKWLSEFVRIDRSVPDLAHLLTMSGLEVESITALGQLPSEVVTARIVEQRPHPNAERLTLCTVETAGGATRQVVCGAKNMKPGDVVVLAQPGAVLPEGMRIERAKLRGESSEGMLCSARELGLGSGHEGLLILEKETPIGEPFSSVYAGADTVLDVSITPNRADCLSVLGVARDISALTGQPLTLPPPAEFRSSPGPAPARLTVEAPSLCPIYYGRVMTGVKVGPSPSWLVARLSAAGLRSINNVVDATNHVLLERGQPLHAFDLETLTGRQIVVRQARAGERIVCLDGVERALDERDLAICDERGVVAVAGVMGGEATAVSDATTQLFLEAAWFAPESVRATARRAGLHTDASHRFERGVDPGGVRAGLDAVTALIQRIAGGEIVGEALPAIAPRPERPTISLSPTRVNALLGLNVPAERMRRHLEALQMQVSPTGDGFAVVAPSYRQDMEVEADLAEEIARLEGYEQLPTTLPLAVMRTPGRGTRRSVVRALVEYLASRGLDQVINYSFIAPQLLEAVRLEGDDPRRQPVRLVNPLSEDLSVLRTLLLPSLLKTAAHNERHQNPDLKIFETGKVFLPAGDGERPRETYRLGCLLMGSRDPRAWTTARGEVDLYDLKGVLESLTAHFRIEGLSLEEESLAPYLAPGQGWTVRVGNQAAGSLGALHPEVARAFGLEHTAYVLEVELDVLWAARAGTPRFKSLPRFPSVERDLAVILDAETPAAQVRALIREVGGALIEHVSIFDVYRGKGIPDGKKSIAFNLTYRAEDRTLVESEVQESHDRILSALESRLGAQLRA